MKGLLAFAVGLVVLMPAAQAQDRKIKSKADLVYPAIAKQMHITGTVKLEVVITPAGLVKSVKVLGGHPMLASAAEDSVKKWKFEPGPAETTEVIPFDFKLD